MSIDNKNRLIPGIQQNNQFDLDQQTVQNQQPWQNKGKNQIRQNFIQRLPLNNEQPFADQSVQNQQWPSTLNSQSSTDLNNGKQDNQQQQNFPQQNQAFSSQPWLNQVPDTKTQNIQRFGSPTQSWQGSQTIQNQPQFQNQNQQTAFETTLGFQNPKDQTNNFQSSPIIAFQPKQWPDASKQSQQTLTFSPSFDIQNTQFGLNQQQKGLPIQSSFDQKQSWSTNQQFQPQVNQLTDSDDLKVQTTQNFAARPISQPWSQNGQMNGNSFETIPIANKGIQRLHGWQSNRPLEQDNNQIPTSDQRKTLDSLSTSLSGSWKSRS